MKKLWCRLFHKKFWHEQRYTDRAQYYIRTECWKCDCAQSEYKTVKAAKAHAVRRHFEKNF